MKVRQSLLMGAMAIVSIAGSPIAFAQDAAPEDGGEEVVVTAMKRGQNLQKVPASISAVTGQTLKDRGLANIEDIANAVPNLNWGEHFGSALITIRGVGSTVDSGITEPTVAMYVDGVYLPRSTMSALRAVDLERVEVLRGPQGTLYGRNATGGAINLISKAPSDVLEGEINLSAGDRSAFGFPGYVSGPIADGVTFRLSGGHEEQDGYVTVQPSGQKLNGTDATYVRGALRIEPNERLSVDLAARWERSTAPNSYQQLLTPTVLPTPGQTTEPNEIIADQPFNQASETLVLSATVNYDFSETLSLRSITSYVDHSSFVDVDADTTILDGFNTLAFQRPSESFGQEFNLIGESGSLKWIVGAYYFHENANNALPLRLGAVFAPGFGVPVDTQLTQGVKSESETFALFGDLTWSITDKFRLALGLRYNHENQNFAQNTFLDIPGVGIVPALPAFAGGPVVTSVSSDEVLPKIGLQYDISDDTMVYAQFSQGYKSGGQNLEGGSGLSVGTLGLYEPEKIDAYEIGLKSRLADRKLTLNLTGFYYDYSDLQVTITVPPTTTLVQNADANIYGFEAEMEWLAADWLKLNAAVTFTHARFDGFSGFDDANPGLGTQNLDGHQLPHAPDFTLNLGAETYIPLGGALFHELTLRADLFHSDDVVLRYFGTPNDTQEAYTLVNLSARIEDADATTALRLFVNNVGDTEYLQNITYIGAVGAYMGNYGSPRTWGVQLTRKF